MRVTELLELKNITKAFKYINNDMKIVANINPVALFIAYKH